MILIEIDGWKFEFSMLPRWDNRDQMPYVFDKLYENPHRDNAVLIYSIAEVGMGRYLGFLAAFNDKNKPQLILNTTSFNVLPKPPQFSKDGTICFISASFYDKQTNLSAAPLLILNFELNSFDCFKMIDSFNYNLDQKSKSKFKLVKEQCNSRWKPFHSQLISNVIGNRLMKYINWLMIIGSTNK